MVRSPFSASSVIPILARIPLLPVVNSPENAAGADALLAEGMFLASRQAGATRKLTKRPGVEDRLAVTRRGYEVRARRRPTPYGVFAGVAIARFAGKGEPPSLRLDGRHRARTNPSAAWLADVRDRILNEPAAWSALTLTTNNLVTRRGERLEHERQASGGARPQYVSIRVTGATTLIMSLCAAGATGRDIRAKIAERRPVPEHVVDAALTELVRDGFLLTDLLPGDFADDPIGQLLRKLIPGHRLRAPLVRLRWLALTGTAPAIQLDWTGCGLPDPWPTRSVLVSGP
ncbi:MAG: lantibiotic dehydratase [Streptosporangiaceae bacterium]